MDVPFIDLKQRFQEEKKEIMETIEKIVEKGHLVLTSELKEFEEDVQSYTGAKYCIGLNSGTDALMMSMWACGIGRGDEVIHPPISFIASTGSIVHVGATPIFSEVDKNGLLDPSRIEEKISPRTKAIMPVHWGGKMAAIDEILKIANDNNLIVLEDSAQSMGSYFKNKHGGTFGKTGSISCHPLKNLNALGDGGLLLTDDAEIAKKVNLYRNHGLESRDNVVMFGVNSRLDVLNSEILKIRLKNLKSVINRRRNNANLYRKYLANVMDRIYLPPENTKDGYEDAYVMFISQADNRDKLKEYLHDFGIETMVYYGKPLHLHKSSNIYGYKKGDFPIAEKQCEMVLALPHHQHLTEEQIQFTSSKILSFYKNN